MTQMSEYPLTYFQMRLWYFDQLEPNTPAYNMSFANRLFGPIDIEALNESVNYITRRHPSLRATFTKRQTDPVQIIEEFKPFSIDRISAANTTGNDRSTEIQNICLTESSKGFDLARGPMYRWVLINLGDNDNVLLFVVHQMVCDTCSLETIRKELMSAYSAIVSGEPFELGPESFHVGQYAVAETEWMKTFECETQIAYWTSKLGNVPEPLELPTDFSRPAFQRFKGSSQSTVLDASLALKINKLASRYDTTLFIVVLAAFKSLLFRYTNQDDLCVGYQIDNRHRLQVNDAVGSFLNTLAIRTDVGDDPNFGALLRRIHENTLDALDNRDVPFEKLLDEIKPERSLARPPIFQVMTGIQDAPLRQLELHDLECHPIDLKISRSHFDLELWTYQSDQRLEISLEYSTDLFEDSTISRMLDHFLILLDSAVSDPDKRISELKILGDEEKTILLDVWGGRLKQVDIPERSVIELFENTVNDIPEKIALVDLHGDAGDPLDYTYAQLNGHANRLSNYLKHRGVGPETKIALLLEPYRFLVIAIFGVLKAGGAYAPLDAKWPESRISFILNDTAAPFVLTDQANLERLTAILSTATLQTAPEVICLDKDWEVISDFSDEYTASKLDENQSAYLIYTSGSTGNPKGVVIEHGALALFTRSALSLYGFNRNDRVFQFSSPSFDSSVEEIFPTLSCGATLVLRSSATLTSLTNFTAECADAGVTVLDLPTAFWQQLATSLDEGSISLPPTLRMVIIGGEQPASDKFRLWQKNAPMRVSLMNTYGPTETTVIVTAVDLNRSCPLGETCQQIPMGKPLEHVKAYILDRNFTPTPIGVPGELCIGGKSLARGYLNLPEKTAERFIRDPFSDDEADRLYRTGDRVRYLKDGQMEFFGRVDRQVKVRGFRVELDEIDNALRNISQISEAFTISRQEGSSPVQLIAFIVCKDDTTVEPSELREELRTKLPDFMIPTSFVTLDKFPLTSGGKIDVSFLRGFDISPVTQAESYVAPRTPVEEVLVNIWQDIFKIDSIGITDNFFDLGGHSLLSLQIIDRVNKAGLRLTPAEFIQSPTIEGQARLITTAKPSAGDEIWQCLVQLQANGSRPPLYLLHSNPGDVLGYVNLVNRLGQDQPCFGFESLGLRDPAMAHKTVEEMASFYIKEMMAFQPDPPYYLGGWCYGGIVACEMAYQLGEMNKEVGLLALIETPFPKMAADRFAYLFNKLLGLLKLGPKGWMFYVRNKIRYMRRLESGSIDSIFSLDLDAGVFSNRPLVYRLNSVAMDTYKMRAFPRCPVRMFVGDIFEEGFIPDIESLWTRMSKDVRRYVAPGTHLTILKEPGVSVVAEILKQCLDEIENSNRSL